MPGDSAQTGNIHFIIDYRSLMRIFYALLFDKIIY